MTFCAVTVLVAAFGHAESVGTSLSHEPIPGVLGPPAGTYAEAQVLVPASFAPGSVTQYRFAGDESWISFDRPLYLGAFSGEERRYMLEFQSSEGTGRTTVSYFIDMRAPEPPNFKQSSGDVEGSLSLEVEGTGDLFISIDGSPFEPLPATRKLFFNAEKDATRSINATVFAVDTAGNASHFSSARWRLHPVGLAPSYPFISELERNIITPIEKNAGIQAELLDLVGSSRLTIKVPDGAVPCIAVNASHPFESIASYVDLSGASAGTCLIPYPWGDDTEIIVHYGYKRDGLRFIVSEPVRLFPRFPVNEAAGTPSLPVSPSVRIEESTAFIDWPATPWTIVFSFGTDEFSAYQKPFLHELGNEPVTLRYYMLDRSGGHSSTASIELPTRYKSVAPIVSGVENGKTYGIDVVAIPQGNARLRYEFIEGNASAPVITASSPVLNQGGLRFEGKPGETVRYQLRIVAESPAQPAGMITPNVQERFLSFIVDRQAPQVPIALQDIRSFSSSDSILSFKQQDGLIMMSISEDGQGAFKKYNGPFPVSGSDEGRKRFIVRAYSEDEFGNRSKEMPRMDILIDRSSLYADAKGRPGASGSPDDPILYLDDALEAAQAAGKRFVYVRGTVSLRRTVVISRPLSIVGGFDADWNEAEIMASITIKIPPSSASWAFVVDGGSISLSSVLVSMNGQGAGGIVFSRSGPVSVSRSSLSLSGGIDMAVLKSNGSVITIESSSLKLSDSVTARGIEASNTGLKISNSTMNCDTTVKLFDAIRISDADASISGLRIEASPSQALSVISSIRSTVNVESAVISISGGASSCRIFSANASSLTVSSVYIDAFWKGSAEAFNALNGSTLRVAHLTALVDAPRAVFASSTGSQLELFNSIVSFSGIDSVFIRSDTMPARGSVSANSLWGFSYYLDGRRTVAGISEFNGLLNPGKPNFSEDPVRMFAGAIKGLFKISVSSACRDGGSVVPWASAYDVLGKLRSTQEDRKPDIGAEEL